jgi:hypothetical protein
LSLLSSILAFRPWATGFFTPVGLWTGFASSGSSNLELRNITGRKLAGFAKTAIETEIEEASSFLMFVRGS